MSNLAFQFSEWAASGRGLRARPIKPDGSAFLQVDIDTISYEVWNVTDKTGPEVGTLDPAEVMLTELASWEKDDVGYSFVWYANGDLWPTADKKYRIVVTFLTSTDFDNVEFKLGWEVSTRAPQGF